MYPFLYPLSLYLSIFPPLSLYCSICFPSTSIFIHLLSLYPCIYPFVFPLSVYLSICFPSISVFIHLYPLYQYIYLFVSLYHYIYPSASISVYIILYSSLSLYTIPTSREYTTYRVVNNSRLKAPRHVVHDILKTLTKYSERAVHNLYGLASVKLSDIVQFDVIMYKS